MKTYLLRGVPASLQMDGWWLSDTPLAAGAPDVTARKKHASIAQPPWRIALLLVLITLADWLLWDHGLGLSLVIFTLLVAVAMLAVLRPRFNKTTGAIAASILLIGLLPMLIYLQFLSVIIGFAAFLVFAGLCALQGQGQAGEVIRAALRILTHSPRQIGSDIKDSAKHLRNNQGWQNLRGNLLADWLLPAGVGAVFLLLLFAANPMFSHFLSDLPSISANPARLGFWLLILAFVWPFLQLAHFKSKLRDPFAIFAKSTRPIPTIFNANSVRNSLVLFNLMFVNQTMLDFIYLWGEAELPKGMSMASYAHRGAYPLVATALLAGLFALISRPFIQSRRFLKIMLLLWMAQNLALVGASVFRLQFYVDSFGLTYLRVAAFIWMGMVAAGLMMICWQVLRARGNGWLLVRISALLVLVLYICSLINFANLIASENLQRTVQVKPRLDQAYLCSLGPMAMPAIIDYNSGHENITCDYMPMLKFGLFSDWREWGFRKWQVQRYLDKANDVRGLHEPENTDHR